jgi:hypothetical protein
MIAKTLVDGLCVGVFLAVDGAAVSGFGFAHGFEQAGNARTAKDQQNDAADDKQFSKTGHRILLEMSAQTNTDGVLIRAVTLIHGHVVLQSEGKENALDTQTIPHPAPLVVGLAKL